MLYRVTEISSQRSNRVWKANIFRGHRNGLLCSVYHRPASKEDLITAIDQKDAGDLSHRLVQFFAVRSLCLATLPASSELVVRLLLDVQDKNGCLRFELVVIEVQVKGWLP